MTDGTNAGFNVPYIETDMSPSEALEMLYNGLKDMSDYDNAEVEKYWDMNLCSKVSYLGTSNVSKIKQALRVAYRAHRGQYRKSGEPFIIHPIEVAALLTDLKMDAETIMAGLLHDTVEDTDLTFTQVEAMFGRVVRSIVEGETKVSKLPKLAFSDYADEQAENLRQMFVAMTEDYRIIIVKLADRLHNMRTLQFMKPEKQQKISRETLDIFAPLAHRMGIWQFKSELEDIAFMYLYPNEYDQLNAKLQKHQKKFQESLEHSKQILEETLRKDSTLRDQHIEFKVYGRTKEMYSLWHKMEMKGEQNLDQIQDVVALRVILFPRGRNDEMNENPVPSDRAVWLCYHVLGLAQHLPGFQPVPTRVKDYISFPKPNGYQSLHTALILNGQTIEIQIRTAAMHQIAEYGMASHWAYTDEKKRKSVEISDDSYTTPWLSSIKEWQDDVECSREFVESVRRELLGKRVFVFLRDGKILNLARGATIIDAAFNIHTEVGLNMHGAEINGKPAPFSYELQNGDVVSILTGKDGKPTTDWMRFAKSRSTRAKLRSYFRDKQRESLKRAGEILLIEFLERYGGNLLSLSDDTGSQSLNAQSNFKTAIVLLDDIVDVRLPSSTLSTHYPDIDDLLIEIGKRHDWAFLKKIMSKLYRVPMSYFDTQLFTDDNRKNSNDLLSSPMNDDYDGSFSSTSSWLSSINVEYADPENCCQHCLPVYEDNIVGTRIAGEYSAVVHRVGCPHAQRVMNSYQRSKYNDLDSFDGDYDVVENFKNKEKYQGEGEEIVELQWPDVKAMNNLHQPVFKAEIVLICYDRKQLLADCSEIVSDIAFIMKTGSVTTEEHATLNYLVKVNSIEHLQTLMDKLNSVPSVMSVERRFGSELL
eukprot:CAMPEP_0178973574 /NCGR_PEP_ID=MMETSP0789-20121207/21826_1 /TAXON_ID=3005 /ORGANISM="Rhizosolenia setigera, Strain CCMP 1694" /LENGTH=871 /DNA_ID=CAMNT_0020661511 /DNA_START=541 /DNA_END=3156 /DNA_ORIENTATION=-